MHERDRIIDETQGPAELLKILLSEVTEAISGVGSILNYTRSPIERLMLCALARALFRVTQHLRFRTEDGAGDVWVSVNDMDEEFVISPQCVIGSFTVDFVVDFHFHRLVKATSQEEDGPPVYSVPERITLVIECDGHDFHEKTKEQVRADKQRDRTLKLCGYEVFRFAGSEVWANADKCASQVAEFFAKRVEEIRGGGET